MRDWRAMSQVETCVYFYVRLYEQYGRTCRRARSAGCKGGMMPVVRRVYACKPWSLPWLEN
jgi:hypothetical protein